MNKRKNGVTLIELLAVIVILGIVAAIAIPALSGMIEKSRINSDIASVKSLNQATYYYAISNQLNSTLFEGIDTDDERMQLLIDEGFLNSKVVPKVKDSLIYWDLDTHYWLYSLNEIALFSDTNIVFEQFDLSSYEKIGTWNSNVTSISSSSGVMFIDNNRTEYTITVSAKISSGTYGGFGILFDTSVLNGTQDTGYIVQFDRGYGRGSVVIRPRTNGTEGNVIQSHRFDHSNSFIPDKTTVEGTAWWSNTHTIRLEVVSNGNEAFSKILSIYIDDVLLFDNFVFQSNVSASNNFTGLRTWSGIKVDFYSLSIQ